MERSVRLQPSGRVFDCGAGDSILDAGLRAGIALPHGCANGSCGRCKARLVEGECSPHGHHDFVFSEAEKAAGSVLLCSVAPETDVVVETHEISEAEEVPFQTIRAKLAKLVRLSEHVMELQLRTPRSQLLVFLPGQYVSITLPGLLPRRRSIASCPCDGSRLAFHVRYLPGDAFAARVFSDLRTGEPVILEGPQGRFILREDARRPLLLFCYDTAFAPIKSLVEQAINIEWDQPMTLYWMALEAKAHYLGNLCRSWVDALDRFTFVPLESRRDLEDGRFEWVESESLTRLSADDLDLSGHDAYVAGPHAVVSVVRERLLARGLPPDRLFEEASRYF